MANNLAAFNAQAWSKRLLKNLDQINIMLPLVNTDYEGELQGVGDTVQVRTLGSISGGAYSGSISYQDLAPVKEPFTVSDTWYFAFKVSDIEKAQTDIDVMDSYTQRAAIAMSNEVERKLLSRYTSTLTANRITGASGAAIALDSGTTALQGIYPVFVEARARLSKQNVPAQGRWFVVDPDTTSLLLNDTAHFIKATDLGDAMVRNGNLAGAEALLGSPGFIGRCAGFDVYECNHIPTSGGAKYLQYGTRLAISYAAQIVEMEAIRLQDSFDTAVRGLLLHDSVVFAEASKAYGYVKAAA
jgi:hypothetical protein